MEKFLNACENNGVINILTVKSVLTGPPCVGKTSFLLRLQKKSIAQKDSQGRQMNTIPSSGFENPVTVNIKENRTTTTAAAISKGQWITTDNIIEQGYILLQSVKQPTQFCEDTAFSMSSLTPDSTNQSIYVVPPSRVKALNTNAVPPAQANPPSNLLNRFLKYTSEFFPSKSQTLVPTRDFVEEVLSSKGMQKLEDLEEITTVYFIDTGGQPEFHELLPPLLRGPALHLIFFNASHNLTHPVNVWFRHRDEKSSSVEYKTSSSSIEMIHQLLSSFYCLSLEDNSKQSVSVLLGSYIDQLSPNKAERSKQIISASSVVLECIGKTEFYKNGFVTFPKSESECNPIFLPLDNATASENELEGIQTFLLQVIKDRFTPISLPVTWAVFHLILRYQYEQSPGVCTLAECTDLGVNCGIQAQDINTVLRHFHKNLGTILYYEEIDRLKEFVICNPGVLFSGIARLVTLSFAGSGERHTAAEEIRKTGEIPDRELPNTTPLTPKCPLNNQHLIELLTHFKLITHIGDDAKPSLFMPSLLIPDPNVLSSLTSKMVITTSPPPLLVFFKGAFIPVGVFSALMVELSKIWVLDRENRYRNRATFISTLFNVEIQSCLAFIDVRLKGSLPVANFCSSVRKVVVDCVNDVLSVQPHVSGIKCFIGFYCPGSLLPSNPVPLHPCECLYTADEPQALLCKNEPRCEGFKESFQICPEYKVWFEVRFQARI